MVDTLLTSFGHSTRKPTRVKVLFFFLEVNHRYGYSIPFVVKRMPQYFH